MEGMTLRRKLFGYSLDDVSKLLADRDRMFAEANRRAQAAEEQLVAAQATNAEMDREMAGLRGELDEMRMRLRTLTDQSEELEALQRQIFDLRSDPLTQVLAGDVIVKFLIAEVAPVLKAAEESAVAMLENAGAETRTRLEEVEAARRTVSEQVEWLRSWRDRIDPMIRGVQARIAETRQRLEEIPERIREALVPVTESMTTANEELTQFVLAADPPLPSAMRSPAEEPHQASVVPDEDAVYVDVPPSRSWTDDTTIQTPEPAWWGM
jgi:chromosome segregation ATPase